MIPLYYYPNDDKNQPLTFFGYWASSIRDNQTRLELWYQPSSKIRYSDSSTHKISVPLDFVSRRFRSVTNSKTNAHSSFLTQKLAGLISEVQKNIFTQYGNEYIVYGSDPFDEDRKEWSDIERNIKLRN